MARIWKAIYWRKRLGWEETRMEIRLPHVGGQGPYLRLLEHLARSSEVKDEKEVKCDRPTDRRTDGRTDKAGCRVACTRLKTRRRRQNAFAKAVKKGQRMKKKWILKQKWLSQESSFVYFLMSSLFFSLRFSYSFSVLHLSLALSSPSTPFLLSFTFLASLFLSDHSSPFFSVPL